MKKPVVDNSEIEAFYDECQEIVSYWNARRHDGGGEIKVTLEKMHGRTTQEVIRIDAEPYPARKNGGRMTVLQIWYDADKSVMLGKTPLLPVDNTMPMTTDRLHQTLELFNP